jgi:hypothetical protein
MHSTIPMIIGIDTYFRYQASQAVVVVVVAAVQIVQADRTSHSVGVVVSERHTAVVEVVAWESVLEPRQVDMGMVLEVEFGQRLHLQVSPTSVPHNIEDLAMVVEPEVDIHTTWAERVGADNHNPVFWEHTFVAAADSNVSEWLV